MPRGKTGPRPEVRGVDGPMSSVQVGAPAAPFTDFLEPGMLAGDVGTIRLPANLTDEGKRAYLAEFQRLIDSNVFQPNPRYLKG